MPEVLWDFEIQADHIISARRPDLVTEKKRVCRIVDVAVPTDYRVKLKEDEKRDKYLDLPKELNKSWNMKVMLIQIVVDAFGLSSKDWNRDKKT